MLPQSINGNPHAPTLISSLSHTWIEYQHLGWMTKTSRRIENRAHENIVLQQNVCFATARQPFVSLEKWQIWKSKFGCFLGKVCSRYSKTWFACLFRSGQFRHLFHSIFRSISAVFSSSFLYLLMNLHCHILAYNMTSLCLAPKELGMNCLQLVHAASIVPVWHFMVAAALDILHKFAA